MSDFDAIAERITPNQLARLLGAKALGGRWRCPRRDHEDRTPSFSVFQLEGRTLGKCHGCGFGGSPVEMASELWGTTLTEAAERLARDIGIDFSNGVAAGRHRGTSAGRFRPDDEIVEQYDYVGASGVTHFQVLRFEHPKEFRQRHPCPSARSGWTRNLGGGDCGCPRVIPILYRLPQVLEAVALGEPVFVVEGEKDVHAVEEAGGVATCNPMGAGKWTAEYGLALKGARVRIVADQDQAGRSHARQVAQFLVGIAVTIEILKPKAGKDAHEHLAAGHKLDDFVPSADDESRVGTPSGAKPTIRVRQELNQVTDEAIVAIDLCPHLRVFVRGRKLVTIGRDGAAPDRWLKRDPGSAVIVPIDQARMLNLLDASADWTKWDARAKRETPSRPPTWVATQILARLEWPYRYLEAVVETPTLRRDGLILSTPGWDEETGLLYAPMLGVTWPIVPPEPRREDVRAAIDHLVAPAVDFPFVASTDRAAYVAAVLSIVGRHMIDGPVPMFVIRAPTPGTGKGLLAEVIAIVGTGRPPPIATMTYDPEEMRKRVHALAIGGIPLVLLDNLSGSVGSDVLAAALTATSWEERILGQTEIVRAPLQAVWLATGNNIAFKRTLGRRVIPIDLDSKLEAPEDRAEFTHRNLRAHVTGARPALATAALTILRAFHLAGRPPHGGPRMGSFESWDDVIRSAVVWAGLDDPAGTSDPAKARGRVRSQADDDLETLGALLEALARYWPEAEPFTTAQLVHRGLRDREFQNVLDMFAPPRRGGRATAHSVGAKLRDHQGRPVGTLVLRKLKRSWRVEATAAIG